MTGRPTVTANSNIVNHGSTNPTRSGNVSNNNNTSGGKPKVPSQVFAMSGSEVAASDDLIQGKCLIADKLLDVLYDSGATHSFISHACVERLVWRPASYLVCVISEKSPLVIDYHPWVIDYRV